MPLPQPELQFRIFNRPSQAALGGYVDVYPTDPDNRPTGLQIPTRNDPQDRYFYTPIRTMDYFIRDFATLFDLPDADTFRATQQLSNVCTWSVSKQFSHDDPRFDDLLSAASTPGAFAYWHISAEGDSPAAIEAFMGGELFTGSPASLFGTNLFPTLRPQWQRPSFIDRGGGGPILKVVISRSPEGIALIIHGTCWGRMLADTMHLRDPGISQTNRTGANGFAQLTSQILNYNSEYSLLELDDSDADETEGKVRLGDDALNAEIAFQTALKAAGVSPVAGRVRTPVALWTVISALTPEARAHLADYSSTIFAAPAGQHSTLRSFQRLAERSDMEFDTSLPVILWQPPRTDSVTWRPEQYFSGSLTMDRPNYTAWGTRQTDHRRNWIVYTPDEATVGIYGHIQKANLSAAPLPLSPAGEPVLDADGNPDYPASDAYIVEVIKAQNTAESLIEVDRESAAVNLQWVAGARLGIDWSLGTRVTLEIKPGVASSAPLVARSVAIGLADGAWSFTAGLGPKVAVQPIFRREIERTTGGYTPYDPGRETLPGAHETPVRASNSRFRPRPHDPGRETIR